MIKIKAVVVKILFWAWGSQQSYITTGSYLGSQALGGSGGSYLGIGHWGGLLPGHRALWGSYLGIRHWGLLPGHRALGASYLGIGHRGLLPGHWALGGLGGPTLKLSNRERFKVLKSDLSQEFRTMGCGLTFRRKIYTSNPSNLPSPVETMFTQFTKMESYCSRGGPPQNQLFPIGTADVRGWVTLCWDCPVPCGVFAAPLAGLHTPLLASWLLTPGTASWNLLPGKSKLTSSPQKASSTDQLTLELTGTGHLEPRPAHPTHLDPTWLSASQSEAVLSLGV